MLHIPSPYHNEPRQNIELHLLAYSAEILKTEAPGDAADRCCLGRCSAHARPDRLPLPPRGHFVPVPGWYSRNV